MKFQIKGPTLPQIKRILTQIHRDSVDTKTRILAFVGAGAMRVIQLQYNNKIYQGPGGAFGYPKQDAQTLVQAVQIQNLIEGTAVVTSRPEATYVEFGTGIYSTIGAKKPITPKRAKALAFPVWDLPSGFKGVFIEDDRKKNGTRLPPGAIGIVLAKSVKGMKPRPVFFAPDTVELINKVAESAIKDEDFR